MSIKYYTLDWAFKFALTILRRDAAQWKGLYSNFYLLSNSCLDSTLYIKNVYVIIVNLYGVNCLFFQFNIFLHG
jgi:hypothetical protein